MSDRSTTDDQSFLYSIRKLKTTDRGHADVFNELFQQLIANDVHLKKSKIDTDGDASNLKVSDITECSSKFPVPEIDDRLKVVIGKVKKFAEDFKGWYTGVGLIDNIVDNCTSMDTDKPLSAAQGKTLWDKIVEVATTLTTHKSSGDHDSRYYTENETNNLLNAKVNTSGIVNNCTSTASNLPLSAAQGKALMDKYNQLNGETSGNARINTTYVTTQSTTHVKWRKLGRIVTVEIYDIILKAGYSTDNVAVIATGLPAPKGGAFCTSVFGYDISIPTTALLQRLNVDASGTLKPWYNGPSVSTAINGSFSYIAAS